MRNGVFRQLLLSRKTKSSAPLIYPRLSPPFLPNRNAVTQASVEEEEGASDVVFPREGPGASYGLNWALAGKGIIVKDKAFHNLKPSELQKYGASSTDTASGVPVYIKGGHSKGDGELTKPQYNKLLKQVLLHISSYSNIFVQDGAVASSPKCDAKVRVISDHASAALSFSSILWKVPTRAISHDSCPLTVYVASSISGPVSEALGLGSQSSAGFIAADVDRASLIMCGKAFADSQATKEALASVAAPIIQARAGLPIPGRLLAVGEFVILLVASRETIGRYPELHKMLVSKDEGAVLSSNGIAPFFRTKDPNAPNMYKVPTCVLIASNDSSGVLPSISKLSPGQAAYHFLAGFQNGKFVPAYQEKYAYVNPLELSKGLLSQMQSSEIPSYLINVHDGEKLVTGTDLVALIQSAVSKNPPPALKLDPKFEVLERKYKEFISSKFPELPEEFAF